MALLEPGGGDPHELCALQLFDRRRAGVSHPGAQPTDNLDLVSAEALEDGLSRFEGTVIAVTHDRWFTRSFDRFVVFRDDGEVVETATPVWS